MSDLNSPYLATTSEQSESRATATLASVLTMHVTAACWLRCAATHRCWALIAANYSAQLHGERVASPNIRMLYVLSFSGPIVHGRAADTHGAWHMAGS